MKYPDDYINKVVIGDCLSIIANIPDGVIQTCITSPPYWGLRDYGVDGQLGLEGTPEEYVTKMVEVFSEVRRVLRDDATLWLNLGDSYATQSGTYGGDEKYKGLQANKGTASSQKQRKPSEIGLKHKDLVGIPWLVAFALRKDGWYLRSDIIWAKSNPMPESVTDRPTKAHEYLFLMSKRPRYYYNASAISEPLDSNPDSWGRHSKKDPGQQAVTPRPMFGPERNGRDGTDWGNGKSRNKRSVWNIPTQPYPEAHFATFPEKLIEPCILAGSREGDIVLDPFGGSGTVVKRSKELSRQFIHIDLGYKKIAEQRLAQEELF